MNIKVCGIRTKDNLAYLNESKVDQIGFIFYNKSKRDFEKGELTAKELVKVTKEKVGVFVDADLSFIKKRVETYSLNVAQLHGEETPAFCQQVRQLGVKVWKAISVYDELPVGLEVYKGTVDVFLFDTKGKEKGGNGEKFDWDVLSNYDLEVPFILSGGIAADDAMRLKKFNQKAMIGIDVNSKFEIEPGLKDQMVLDKFIKELKNED
ncbi:MAG: phosphoribosylanthranilate isomerase [Reichenbachiella sp.]